MKCVETAKSIFCVLGKDNITVAENSVGFVKDTYGKFDQLTILFLSATFNLLDMDFKSVSVSVT